MEGLTEVCLSFHSHLTETCFLKVWVNGSLPMGGESLGEWIFTMGVKVWVNRSLPMGGGGKPEYLKKNLENQPENQ